MSYIMKVVEGAGYSVLSPGVLVPKLLTPLGVLGSKKPAERDYEDISLGKKVLESLGKFDVGQAVIVENFNVLGIEGAEGTDELILRCAKLKREKRRGVLVKMKKICQSGKVDLPVIGIQTVENVYKSGFKGIALEATASLIVEIEKVVKLANKYKIVIIGIDSV